MTDSLYITASCKIENNIVYKNTAQLFHATDADLPGFLLSVYKHLGSDYPRFYKMDHLSKLGWLASEILLKDSFIRQDYHPEETGIVLSNASASLDTDISYFETVKDIPSPSVFVYTLPNIVTGEICIRQQFKGETAFFITENFDADLLAHYTTMLLNSNILQACVCGWVEIGQEDYKAVLFLIEKGMAGLAFTKENMNQLFNT